MLFTWLFVCWGAVTCRGIPNGTSPSKRCQVEPTQNFSENVETPPHCSLLHYQDSWQQTRVFSYVRYRGQWGVRQLGTWDPSVTFRKRETDQISVSDGTSNWWDAHSRCSVKEGNMYTPGSDDIPPDILGRLQPDTYYWIGAMDYLAWIWTEDGSPLYKYAGFLPLRDVTQTKTVDFRDNSVWKCHLNCSSYSSMGMQGNTCYCLPERYETVSPSTTENRCPGNFDELCGNVDGMSVYKLGQGALIYNGYMKFSGTDPDTLCLTIYKLRDGSTRLYWIACSLGQRWICENVKESTTSTKVTPTSSSSYPSSASTVSEDVSTVPGSHSTNRSSPAGTSDAKKTPYDPQTDAGGFIGLGVGSVVLVVLAVLSVVFLLRRQKKLCFETKGGNQPIHVTSAAESSYCSLAFHTQTEDGTYSVITHPDTTDGATAIVQPNTHSDNTYINTPQINDEAEIQEA